MESHECDEKETQNPLKSLLGFVCVGFGSYRILSYRIVSYILVYSEIERTIGAQKVCHFIVCIKRYRIQRHEYSSFRCNLFYKFVYKTNSRIYSSPDALHTYETDRQSFRLAMAMAMATATKATKAMKATAPMATYMMSQLHIALQRVIMVNNTHDVEHMKSI